MSLFIQFLRYSTNIYTHIIKHKDLLHHVYSCRYLTLHALVCWRQVMCKYSKSGKRRRRRGFTSLVLTGEGPNNSTGSEFRTVLLFILKYLITIASNPIILCCTILFLLGYKIRWMRMATYFNGRQICSMIFKIFLHFYIICKGFDFSSPFTLRKELLIFHTFLKLGQKVQYSKSPYKFDSNKMSNKHTLFSHFNIHECLIKVIKNKPEIIVAMKRMARAKNVTS